MRRHNRLHPNEEEKFNAGTKPKFNDHLSPSIKCGHGRACGAHRPIMKWTMSLISISAHTPRPVGERAIGSLDRIQADDRLEVSFNGFIRWV